MTLSPTAAEPLTEDELEQKAAAAYARFLDSAGQMAPPSAPQWADMPEALRACWRSAVLEARK